MKAAWLCIYSAGHFWVDFSCALLMFSQVSGTGEWALCALLYNFCAFALQMPIGLLADRLGRSGFAAALGCALAAAGWGLAPLHVAAAVTAGLGNACFHVGGGVKVLRDGRDRAAPLGIFVSPGALGIFFGTLLGRRDGFPGWVSASGLLLFALAFLLLERREGERAAPGRAPSQNQDAVPVLVCCFLVVVLRSYLGMVMTFSWKTGSWALALTCALVLGKAAGGFLGDRLGMVRAAVLSLGLAAALFCLSGSPWAGTAAVFLFNMTMPITLWAAARLLPPGLAFGTLTFALFLGFLPVWLGWPVLFTGGTEYAAGALCSLALLALGLKRGRL